MLMVDTMALRKVASRVAKKAAKKAVLKVGQ